MAVTDELRDLRERAGISVRTLADALGMPSSTYAQYESSRYKKRFLPLELTMRIAKELDKHGVARADTMALAGVAVADGRAMVVGTETLTVKSSVAAGVWKEQPEWPEDEWYPLTVGPVPVAGGERFAVQMQGHSMDLTIPPKSDLECLRVAYGEIEPVPGDLVIVARHRHDTVETTCKRLDRDGDEWVLRMESSKPEFQEVIRLGRPSEDLYTDDEIAVVGIVLKAHQQHFRRR